MPFRLGVRQIDVSAYPSRPFYTFDFNDYNIEDRVLGRFVINDPPVNLVYQEIEKEKNKILKGFPLKVKISRDINVDIEKLTLDEVRDKDGNLLPKNFFIMQVQSMSEIENFWLDSGIFSLNLHI
ncbi:MAG: virulence factor SrfB [Saprospiraceae bacterium]|nr:virulence factor SrfB [Saprospiraceae bacterium]